MSEADRENVELNKPYSSTFNGINRHFGSTNLDFENEKQEVIVNQQKNNINNQLKQNFKNNLCKKININGNENMCENLSNSNNNLNKNSDDDMEEFSEKDSF